ncbi:MAG: hypothetical protein EZS28_017847 [Streblomastix strix]|uniref:Uncharacterized protein n=1 Tax=Streblomastix strix TaxID=222440 RepID=A0A5J4VVF8_9EUKA|nr:MAG: hypothetical protein EZS28_017847 [Streblomastix strix]
MQPRPQRGGRAPHIVEFRIVYFGVLHHYAAHFTFTHEISHAPGTKNEDETFLSTIDRIGIGYLIDIAKNIDIKIDNQCLKGLNISGKD